MGRVEHPSSTAADQGWSAHPSDPGTKKPRIVRSFSEGQSDQNAFSRSGYAARLIFFSSKRAKENAQRAGLLKDALNNR